MTRRLPAIAVCLVCGIGVYGVAVPAVSAASQDDRVKVLEEKLDRSIKLIEQLSARVRALEAQQAGAAAPAQAARPAPPVQSATASEPTPPVQQRLDSVEQQLAQLEDSSATRGVGGGIPLHGFFDAGIGNHTADRPEFKGTNIGALDIFLNPQLGEHTRSLFELTFEVNEQGEILPDLERAQIGYQFSEAATLWIGRFHTPFGYYNTAFHHGQELATSLRRPRFLLFEDQGGIMPNHTVGAWLTGADHIAAGKLTYDLFVGNGQAIASGTIDQRNGGVDHGGAIYGGNLGYVFGETMNGLKLGVSGFRAEISDDQQAGRITRVDNAGVYFAYDSDRFEHLGEFYRFNDSDLTNGGPVHHSSAGFLQLAWRLRLATPYIRYERAVLDQRDDYFALQTNGMSYFRTAAGLRFDLDAWSALKLEFARTKNTDRLIEQWTDVMLDYAIRF